MCRVFANQNSEIRVSTSPLNGIGSGSTTSKADSRSVVDDQQVLGVHVVDVAHLALVNLLQAAHAGLEKRWRLRKLFHVCAACRLLPLKGRSAIVAGQGG